MKTKDEIVVEKMCAYAQKAIQFCDGISSCEEFDADSKTNMACVFALMQIGELCASSLSDEYKHKLPNLPWAQIKGLRNRIVHGYEGVENNIVWETIKNDLPKLLNDLQSSELAD